MSDIQNQKVQKLLILLNKNYNSLAIYLLMSNRLVNSMFRIQTISTIYTFNKLLLRTIILSCISVSVHSIV